MQLEKSLTKNSLGPCTSRYHAYVAQRLHVRQAIRVVFIDNAKAFDHVDHATVTKKLAALGVSQIILCQIPDGP